MIIDVDIDNDHVVDDKRHKQILQQKTSVSDRYLGLNVTKWVGGGLFGVKI
jgi:hypothetical protein